MLKRAIHVSNTLMQRYLPDPFLFVILLTMVVFGLGLIFTGSTPVQMVQYWGEGFWNLLSFSMQMVLVLVTGFVLASSPVFKQALGRLASTARTPGQAVVIVTVVSLAASWINWGFGLVIGALVRQGACEKGGAGRLQAFNCKRLLWVPCLAWRIGRLNSIDDCYS